MKKLVAIILTLTLMLAGTAALAESFSYPMTFDGTLDY